MPRFWEDSATIELVNEGGLEHVSISKGFFMGEFDLGPQTEGRLDQDGKGDNLSDYWYRSNPIAFIKAGTGETSTFMTEDLDLLLETGHTAGHLSSVVPHFLPEGRGRSIKRVSISYRRVFEKISQANSPLVNLYHFDLPMALQDKGWLGK